MLAQTPGSSSTPAQLAGGLSSPPGLAQKTGIRAKVLLPAFRTLAPAALAKVLNSPAARVPQSKSSAKEGRTPQRRAAQSVIPEPAVSTMSGPFAFGGRSVLAWKPGDKAPSVIAKGPGGFDGVEIVGGGILVSSWNDSTVSSYETGQEVKLITGVPSPADIGYDAKRNRVVIPILTGNRVEIWQLP
jgi:hypothetical protein